MLARGMPEVRTASAVCQWQGTDSFGRISTFEPDSTGQSVATRWPTRVAPLVKLLPWDIVPLPPSYIFTCDNFSPNY